MGRPSHATAIEDGDDLIKCIVYIDLNMVRAGVAKNTQTSGHIQATMKFSNQNVKVLMGGMALGRKVLESGESFQLKEVQYPCIAHFGTKKSEISAQNTYVWDQNFENAMT